MEKVITGLHNSLIHWQVYKSIVSVSRLFVSLNMTSTKKTKLAELLRKLLVENR